MLKLKRFSKIKPCYYCGARSNPSIREHAPPATMFTGFNCDRITVPSCSLHNNEKDDKDQAIVIWLLLAMYQTDKNGFSITENVKRAIEIAQDHFAQAKKDVSLRPLLASPTNFPEMAYIHETEERRIIRPWMCQLTAALVWSVIGEWMPTNDFESAWVYSHDFISSHEPMQHEDYEREKAKAQRSKTFFDSLAWNRGWPSGKNNYPSDIFSFDLSFIDNSEQWDGRNMIFRYRFYNSMRWYVWFKASAEAKQLLKLETNHLIPSSKN
jgi:hypothetical protein